MAKKKTKESQENDTVKGTENQGQGDQQQGQGDDLQATTSGGQPMPAWKVSVNCPTPLARNPAIVNAFDETGAWSVFCAMNGISGTDHQKSIELVQAEADPET